MAGGADKTVAQLSSVPGVASTCPEVAIFREGAHELRNQLAVALLELGQIAEPRARMLEADIRYASDTIRRIALLARLMSGEPLSVQEIEIATALTTAIEAVRGKYELGRMTIDVANTNGRRVLANRGVMTEVIFGLLDNAVRHTRPGTRISVDADDAGTIIIVDDGPGFADADLARLGEPFRAGRVSTAGAGLGLAIGRAFATRSGGELEISNAANGGARVALKLPGLAGATAPAGGGEGVR